ncbi:hypothetical protein PRUPE_4G265700 [Prunus persica]|uniref:Uncharacterized protein n=1 Tax=Prunus persica TaxID=3760 RepID=A0A251PRF9_PRUPE|nr:hypothetical protein PRUPE_4G265700 [Prunus persica]
MEPIDLDPLVSMNVGSANAISKTTATAIDDVSVGKGVLIVVHPNLENHFVHINLIAKLMHNLLVPLLHLSPNPVCNLVHLVLMVLAELGHEPLPCVWVRRNNWGVEDYESMIVIRTA